MTGAPKASTGLAMEYSEELGGFVVTGMGECTDTDLVIPATHEGKPVVAIADGAFAQNETITSLTIIGGVQVIGTTAFKEVPLERICILGSVKTIEYGAFFFCAQVRSIVLSDSITMIDEAALALFSIYGATVYYMGTEEQWQKITIIDDYKMNAGTLASVTFNYVYEG